MKVFKFLIFLSSIIIFHQCSSYNQYILTINNKTSWNYSIRGIKHINWSQSLWGNVSSPIPAARTTTINLGTVWTAFPGNEPTDHPYCISKLTLYDEFGNPWKWQEPTYSSNPDDPDYSNAPFKRACNGNLTINITCAAPGGCENINNRRVAIS